MIGGAKGIGLGIDLGLVNQYNRTGSQSYIEPEVLDSLVGVWSAYGMTNDSPNRSTIKNKLSNKGGDFVISNAAYDKMSSYGGYEFAKFDNTLDWYNTEGNDSVVVVSRNGHSITLKRLTGPNFWYFQNSTFRGLISNVIPFKVNSNKNISVIWDVHGLSISEGKDKSVRVQELVLNPNEDNYTNLKTLNEEELAQIDISTNSLYYLLWFDLSTLAVDEEVTIEMLPLFEGAFVTDGIDDLITSTKTVQEMLGGSNEITVVSMIHQVKDSSNNVSFTNYIRGSANGYFRNIVNNYDKTGIYGYTSSDLKALSVVNNILGDKNDYTSNGDNRDSIINGNFSVQGYSYNDGNNTGDFSSVAWYWTIIANKVLTTDQINQVIAYFNLDRTLKSDIYCNIAKQGITNENHAEFGDKLIDFSGNGRDIQLNNLAWDGDSGIGKYNYPNWKVTATIANTYSTIVNYPTVNGTYSINVNGVSELMQSIGLHLEIKYTTSTGIIYNDIKQDGVYSYILPDGATDLTLRFGGIPGIVNEPCNITITQIPSHAGALCLDGVNDFGQFVGDLELKDYTFIADRAYSRIAPSQVPFIASTQTNGQAPFLMEYLNEDTYVYPHSFGTTTKTINLNIQRQISYQSTYVYNGNSISKGISVDTGDGLTIGNSGSTGAQYSPLCLWSLMLFPYSMSEFLIERQLKKHKLGTLYPDMVEFRPVINSNVLLDSKPTFVIRGTSTHLNAGDYVPENSQIWVSIKMNNIADRITKFTVNGKTIDIPENAYSEVTLQYGFPFVIDKSPQKIGITIEQDENYVLFNPVITSNVEYHRLDFYLNNYQKIINIGDYIPKDAYLRANIYLNNNVDELTAFIFNGVNIGYRRSSVDDTAFNISHIYNYDSPQEVNITIDEYIRYEDIVQPYPVLLRFNDENGNEVSWGGKFRVGSTITRIGSSADSNLLPNIYNIFGLLLNDNQVTSSKVIVEKTMVFKAKSAYIFDNNEPNCILSPRLLRIPNSSYKILGYIPDISGHGNHGVIHNSAYAEGSGVNEDGSYQFDGVDDFITIPTTVGGKQVLMKVNWQSIAGTAILYDQRTNGGFAIFNRDFDTNENKVPAYRARNIGGSTYIDGILNEYIYASELKDITHNIVELCDPELNTGTLNPKIGSSFLNSNYTQMSLYDFMLFDEISTDDKIKELNKYVGIEGNVFEFNPTFTIDLPMAIKSIKVYQGGNEISPGYLYPNKDTEFEVYVSLNDGKYAVDTITVDGVEITKDRVVGEYNIFKFTLNGSSEQKITIHSYEYIMYEDIIQPYPSFVKLENLDRTHTYTWGDKLRIGDTIRYNSSKNLLEGAYTLRGQLECNGVYVFDNNQQIVVTKEMVFAWSHSPVWTIGNSAPKCVFSPSKLRIPNSSYKYLGYIPDISGNGNNGTFTNFAFSGMSGANGYLEDFTIMKDHGTSGIVRTESKIYLNESFNYKEGFWLGYTNNPSPAYKVKVSGIPETGMLTYTGGIWLNLVNGINELPARTNTAENHGFVVQSPGLDWSKLVIEQIGNYEGSICFDGIDDYVDIPSLSIGGKQVLMKTNWLKSPTLLYDQRASGSFAILTTKEDDATNPRIAYQARNQDGKTYIDGIENNYIETYSLKGITHNITVTNPSAGSGVVPVIGANTGKSSGFAKMALYDFMLFDEVSTNEEIKQLNDIVGIEGNYVQRPPYYWDAYGKTNSDEDRSTIQQRGTAVGDYDLTNHNHAYDKMSGYGGYNLGRFDKSWASSSSSNTSIKVVQRNPYDITLKKLGGNSDWEFNNTELKIISNPVSVKFKSDKNIRFTCDYHYYPVGENSEGIPLGITSKDLIANEDTIITISPISQENIDKYNIDVNRGYYLIYFQLSSTLAVNEEVTIEMLPLYPNALLYDGVDDYSENTSIPAFTDYTYIIKYEDFNNPNTGSCIQRKGSIKAGGGAFVQDHIYRGTKYQYNFGISSNIHKDDSIAFCTRTNYNGTAIPSGNNTDDTGFTIGKFDGYRKMVFYKEMLYPRTVNMLTINMIKNMMAEDGIIDIQGKLFTDKFTGDFNLDFNKDFLIGN